MGVIRSFAVKRRSNAFNPFATVQSKNPIPAFGIVPPFRPSSVGAGAVGGTGTGQYDYQGSAADQAAKSGSGTDWASQIPGLVAATGSAIAQVVDASKSAAPMTSTGSSIQPLTSNPPATTTSAPLGVPLPYWFGAAAVVGGAFWWASKGRRRRR